MIAELSSIVPRAAQLQRRSPLGQRQHAARAVQHIQRGPGTAAVTRTPVSARYHLSRLGFRRSVIEPLHDEDVFEVETPVGVFRMTKRDFYSEFPNVVVNTCYVDRGVIDYPVPPKRALRYLVQGGANASGGNTAAGRAGSTKSVP